MRLTYPVLMVGLTGGIGSGKSAVAARLAAQGAVIIDADALARDVVAPGTDGLGAVTAEFGSGVLDTNGALDRSRLAAAVFGDEAARRRLEAIIHPRVRARTGELTAAAAPDAVVVNDVPLLVEAGLGSTYHLVVVVRAREAERVARLVARRGMTEAEAYARIRAQATDAQRAAAADVLLTNDGAPDGLDRPVRALWTERLRPYEENVRLRRAAPRDPELALSPYDPGWPVEYARLAARIRRAAGPLGQRVDHIGSTAVPDLPAKDFIDIQLTVASLADADALADPLGAAGFPALPGVWQDTPKPDAPDPGDWQKRFHSSADPARPVNLHVRVNGSPGWRYALRMRDYLRAEPAARAGYAALKARLVATVADRGAYADEKEPWFTEVWPRMTGWAEATGWTPDDEPDRAGWIPDDEPDRAGWTPTD